MDEKNILFYTRVYNSEATLPRCIDSILNQTVQNYKYFLADNGSTDGTRSIIERYSDSNKHIIPLYYDENKQNRIFDILDIELGKNTDGYLCTLDADDEYTPDFLEKMLTFMEENNLEVATCGSDWINEQTGEIIKHDVLDKSILLEGKAFAEQFPYYRRFLLTIWGTVYSLQLLRECSFEWARNDSSFPGTAFCMEAYRYAERAGILAESLHKYYISPEIKSYRFDPGWFQKCKYMYKISREYLLDYGEISKQNEDYLCVMILIFIKYILPRIQLADVDLSEKYKSLKEIFTDNMTQCMLKHWDEVGIYSNKMDFLQEIEAWIYEQDGWIAYREIVEEIIASLNIKKGRLSELEYK